MDLSEINWDFNSAGSWPLQLKVAVILIICCLVAGGGYYQFTMDQLAELDKLEKEEATLIDSFKAEQRKAVNLEDYREQLKQIQGMLKKMMKQMPKKSEVADLLKEISQTALKSGLEPRLFLPEAEERKENLYIELPYSIEMVGKYEELGLFISGLAALPRIVTVHNVDLSPAGGSTEEAQMLLKATIKTYTEAVDDSAEDK